MKNDIVKRLKLYKSSYYLCLIFPIFKILINKIHKNQSLIAFLFYLFMTLRFYFLIIFLTQFET